MSRTSIGFSGPLIPAVRANAKTETRRIIKPQPRWIDSSGRWEWVIPKSKVHPGCCTSVCTASREWHEYLASDQWPYQAGDRLYVRESWAVAKKWDHLPPSKIPRDLIEKGIVSVHYLADGPKPDWCGRTRSLRYMPKWASRLTIEITEVGAETVKQIDRKAAAAEGICHLSEIGWNAKHNGLWVIQNHRWPEENFAAYWDFLNDKKHGCMFSANPWVWVIRFKVIA